MYFLPEARGKGLGKDLITRCLSKANDFNMLPVWGQYPTGTDNGMEMGEKMTWLAQKKDNTIYEIESSYQRPLMSIYIKDGASAVLGMELTASENLKPLNPFKK